MDREAARLAHAPSRVEAIVTAIFVLCSHLSDHSETILITVIGKSLAKDITLELGETARVRLIKRFQVSPDFEHSSGQGTKIPTP